MKLIPAFIDLTKRKLIANGRALCPLIFASPFKLIKTITHELRLRDCEAVTEQFIGEVSHLGPKLGVVLMQLPPSLKFEFLVVTKFIKHLRKIYSGTIVCEPRHISWFTDKAADLLREFRVSYVVADPPVNQDTRLSIPEADVIYVRLHGYPEMYYSNYPVEGPG